MSRITRRTIIPVNQITPLTYRDGVTYIQLLTELSDYIKTILHPSLQHTVDQLVADVEHQMDKHHDQYVDGVQEFQRIHDAFMSDVNAHLIALNDGAVSDLVQDDTSLLGRVLRSIFPDRDDFTKAADDLEFRASQIKTDTDRKIASFTESQTQDFTTLSEALTTTVDDAVQRFDVIEQGVKTNRVMDIPDGLPTVVAQHHLYRDDDGRLEDGAGFVTIVDTGDDPRYPLGRFYSYASGHDSTTMWLLTADNFLGPYTWQHPVIGLPGSGARMTDSRFQAHTASPHAMYENGVIRLYYHGPTVDNIGEQPTALATSYNGVDFQRGEIVLPTDYTNNGSPYRTSTSYARIVKHGGVYHAIWQGTTGRNSVIDGYTYAPVPVGYATSTDGMHFNYHSPIITNGSKDQGLFAPGLMKVADGWFVMGSDRRYNGAGGQELSIGVYRGPTLDNLHYVGPLHIDGLNSQVFTMPEFHTVDNTIYVVGSNNRNVIALELEIL